MILRPRGTGLVFTDPDPRSADHRIADVLTAQPDRRRVWPIGKALDQGQEGACVGFGFTAELMAAPYNDRDVPVNVADAYARDHYHRAREVLGWTGPPDGATILSGAKVAVERGFFDAYAWAGSITEIRDAIVGSGPVVIGVPWSGVVGSVNRHGILRVNRGGTSTSGHCLLVSGYDPRREVREGRRTVRRPMYRLTNSWGPGWASTIRVTRRHGRKRVTWHRSGSAWVHAADLDWLLAQRDYREAACLPIGRRPVDLAAWLHIHQA